MVREAHASETNIASDKLLGKDVFVHEKNINYDRISSKFKDGIYSFFGFSTKKTYVLVVNKYDHKISAINSAKETKFYYIKLLDWLQANNLLDKDAIEQAYKIYNNIAVANSLAGEEYLITIGTNNEYDASVSTKLNLLALQKWYRIGREIDRNLESKLLERFFRARLVDYDRHVGLMASRY